MTVVREGDLEFEVSESWSVAKLDRQTPGVPSGSMPHGMQLVDLLLESNDSRWLIEAKDYRGKPERDVVNQEFAPKARDSYCWLHLMARDDRPIHYVVVVGVDRWGMTAAGPCLSELRDRLETRILKEDEAPWKRRYVEKVHVVEPARLADILPGVKVRRVSAEINAAQGEN